MLDLAENSVGNPKATKTYALASLSKWAQEMRAGASQPNILARLLEAPGDGNGAGMLPPGWMFTARSQETDQLLHQIRLLDPFYAKVLVAKALGLSLTDMAREFRSTKSQMQVELDAALAALRMGLHFRHPIGS
jgi:hypothetical protein